MQDVADQSAAPTTIGADLCAIFVSLELSRSTWLATSLSPGRGEKMSKHSVSAGDIAAAAGALFQSSGVKACARTGKSFPIVVIPRSGVGRSFSGLPPCLAERKELRVLLSMQPQFQPPAGGVRPRLTGSTARLSLRALLAHKRGEPRVCSMVRTPTPEDEDRRRICRERKVLINGTGPQHVNRIKGLCCCLLSGRIRVCRPLRRDRRARLDALPDWRWPSPAPTSQSPGLSRTRSA